MYLRRAVDSVGDTVDFWSSEHCDLPATKRFLRKALDRHGRAERIAIDGSQTKREAIIACDGENLAARQVMTEVEAYRYLKSQYLNNRIEQDHRRIKRRIRPMLGFKSLRSAGGRLHGIGTISSAKSFI